MSAGQAPPYGFGRDPMWLPLQSGGFAEFGGHICFFPGEVWSGSSEMAAIGSLCVDWAGKLQMHNHFLRGQGEKLSDNLADFFLADF